MSEPLKVRLIKLTLSGLSRLPLGWVQSLAAGLGAVVWRLDWKQRATAVRNVQLCFPDASPQFHCRMARAGTLAMAQSLLESPRLFRLTDKQLLSRLENPAVLDELISVYQQGKGLMIATPHLGSWEYVGLLLSAHTRMTSMFRPPRIPQLTDWIRRARQTAGATLVPTDASGVRALTKALAQGECSGILPDQEPDEAGGVYAPFFGVPALSMTLLPRLVRKRQTPVAFLIAERRPQGKFRLCLNWAEAALYDPDPEVACRCMNSQIEALVRAFPEQFNWPYRRFKYQPDGQRHYVKAELRELSRRC